MTQLGLSLSELKANPDKTLRTIKQTAGRDFEALIDEFVTVAREEVVDERTTWGKNSKSIAKRYRERRPSSMPNIVCHSTPRAPRNNKKNALWSLVEPYFPSYPRTHLYFLKNTQRHQVSAGKFPHTLASQCVLNVAGCLPSDMQIQSQKHTSVFYMLDPCTDTQRKPDINKAEENIQHQQSVCSTNALFLRIIN